MAHVRKLLRDAVVTVLTGLATTGAKVFVDRVYVLQEAELPALLVTINDTADLASVVTPEIQARTFSLRVEAVGKYTVGLSDTLDQAALEVEIALSAPLVIGGKSLLATYLGTDAIQSSGEADRPIGSLVLNFEIPGFTQANAPAAFF